MSVFENACLKNIIPEEWMFYGLWKQDVLSACFWQDSFDEKELMKFGFEITANSAMIANGGYFFCHKPSIDKLAQQVREMVSKNNTKPLNDFAKSAKKAYAAGVEFAKKTAANAPLNRGYFHEFLHHAKKMSFYWWLSAAHLTVILERLLQEKVVEHKIPAENVPSIVPRINTPLTEQQADIIKLKKKIAGRNISQIKTDPKLFAEIESCRKKYAWIEVCNWIGEELSFERLLSQIEYAKENDDNHITKLKHIPADIKKISECLGCVAFPKQAGAEYMSMYELAAMPYLQRLAKSFGITHRELVKLTIDEIEAALLGNKSDKGNIKTIVNSESRKNARWIVISKQNNGKLCLVDDKKDISVFEEKFIPRIEKGMSEVKGQTGNKGKATGTAKIILNVDEFNKMKPKDVLVTTMTTPDFVVLMQKASAIVTDIGGILCHAAIMSREMKKPCVIGTKIATQVLKDGDYVEVDADKGIVRRIG